MAAGETPLTITGNLTADPELRHTPNGAAVANFTVASTPRMFDKNTNEWKDGETLFMRCSIWREAAENVASSLTKGARVIVSGRLKQVSWTDKETGANRTSVELEADEVGPSLKYATAQVTKVVKGGGNGGGNYSNAGSNNAPSNESTASSAPAADNSGFGGGF